MTTQVIEIKGERFVVIPEKEYHDLRTPYEEGELPAYPETDVDGNMPASEFIRVSIARDLIHDRRTAGLSRKELADLAGVREQTVVRLESGKHSSSERTLEKIDNALKDALKKTTRKSNKKAKH